MKKTQGAIFPVDILLLVMMSEEIVWHFGPHTIVNMTGVILTSRQRAKLENTHVREQKKVSTLH